ncbi:MAG: hypothetical protein ASARMPREDX12_007723 [Alectoria sarmentosa]|nr:MAG: hypothetical protein ASARMPREDX12_007723 [Alectoria sarmentosa]
MRTTLIPIFLLPFLASVPTLASNHLQKAAPIPRSLDAILVEPLEPTPTPTPTPTSHINHLDLRQVAAGVGGAGAAAAPAQPAAVVPAAAAGAEVDPTDSPTVAAGGAASATAVKSGAIGLGTLTGKVGVVNTKDAKSDAVGNGMGVEVLGILGCWVIGIVVGGGWMGMGIA